MFDKLITRNTLADLAGETAFRRGAVYFSAGAVDIRCETDDSISAQVDGTTECYQVELRNNEGVVGYGCTCPQAAESSVCEHCVAVGLAWLSEHETGPQAGKIQHHDLRSDIRDYLGSQEAEVLIGLLLVAAERDERFYRFLSLKAKRAAGENDVAKTYRRAIDNATRILRFVDWQVARDYALNLEQVVKSLAELLTAENAGTLVELAEYAIERVESVLQEIDDTNGDVGGIVETLGDLHLRACELAMPEPRALAERLFQYALTSPFGIFSLDPGTYRDALGAEGLQRYRELALSEWAKIEQRQGSDPHNARHYRMASIMESLARASGDIEGLVAIKARDLSSVYRYLSIAEIWAQAEQHDKALNWAERGLAAFPKVQDNPLRDFLISVYLQCRRNDEALRLSWAQFEERPSLIGYQNLHRVAEPLGIWKEQRQRALARVAEATASGAGRWKLGTSAPDYSLRVAIALWEDDLNAAWEAVHSGICSSDLLTSLAAKLEAGRADDALTLYKRVIPMIVEQNNPSTFVDAVKVVLKIKAIMQVQKREREFVDYLTELYVRFKLKRNFIKLLDGVR
ncbi:MAG: SWIM zinc finger family protein [Gammaproteobacteria bacterium]